MIPVGHTDISPYKIWIAPASISMSIDDPEASNSEYFEVLVSKEGSYYDPQEINYLSLENNRPTAQTDLKEFEAFLARKSIPIPLSKMKRDSVYKLLQHLESVD